MIRTRVVDAPRPVLGLALFGLVLLASALAFQGSRGLAEPDEGRYASIAAEMLQAGDLWIPRLHGAVYIDKPPAIYWSAVAGMKILGVNEWGLRLGQALALAATALLVGIWAGRSWGGRAGRLGGLVYVTTLMPVVAANTLTPDTLLTLWATAASLSYWIYRDSRCPAARWRSAALLGCAVGLGLFTKGAAMLVFLAPIVVHGIWETGPRRLLRRPELWVAAIIGAAIGAPWYLIVSLDLPGAAEYFFNNEVAGRLWEDVYHRNPQWWAPATVYGTVLVFGTLPWSLTWWRLWSSDERRLRLQGALEEPLIRYLGLSIGLPLLVFSLSQSRLHLYILPLFPSLTMLTVFLANRTERVPNWPKRMLLAVLAVVILRALSPFILADRSTRTLAEQLNRAGVTGEACIDLLQIKAHGLRTYGYPRVFWHTIWPEAYSASYESPRTLKEDLPLLVDECGGRIHFIVQPKFRIAAVNLLESSQLACSADRVLSERASLLSCVARPMSD